MIADGAFREALPRSPDGEPDIDVWLDQASGFSTENRVAAVGLLELLSDSETREAGLELLELLLRLRMDFVTVMAGMTLFAVQRGIVDANRLPEEIASVVLALLPLANIHGLSFSNVAVLSSQSKSQTDNVRHMLIALINDPRVVVIKLAERVVTLSRAKDVAASERRTMAREAMEFFVPLANRLGIWQLKWMLEDQAFSCLHPTEYRTIADKLDDRREARERQVEAIRQDLEFRLSAAGITAEVHGRAKHIYSIWRKMIDKDIDLSEVRDMQAVRVLVDSVGTCYSVLGIVHTSWPHIPTEFDDYIANPKKNGYRSIHTAVIGPAGKTLEVQIRTHEMHDECELGLCAHWAYKSEEVTTLEANRHPSALQSRKIDWLRGVLEWHDEIDTAANGDYMAQEQVFVTTPRGHVLDLSPGATALDFAYRVHTEVGHRCRGARVDGRRVPLNRPLVTGECVEIETGEEEAPKREWLDPALGYVKTSRSREKIRAWFKSQVVESNLRAGRALLDDTMERLGLGDQFGQGERVAALAERAGYKSADDLLIAVGVGDQLVFDLVKMLPSNVRGHSLIERIETPEQAQGVMQGVIIRGRDRQGLLRDVMAAVADLSVWVVGAEARADMPGTRATITMRLNASKRRGTANSNGATEMVTLARVIDAIRRVPDVEDVRRTNVPAIE